MRRRKRRATRAMLIKQESAEQKKLLYEKARKKAEAIQVCYFSLSLTHSVWINPIKLLHNVST